MLRELCLIGCLAAATIPVYANESPMNESPMGVRLETGSEEWVRRDAPIQLVLSRSPEPQEGRLAIWIGNADLTELFSRKEATWTFRPGVVPLPAGEGEVVVYLGPTDGEWQEVARLPLKVLRRGGLRQATFTPRLDISSKGRLDESESALQAGNEGESFDDVTGQVELAAELARSGWRLTSRLNALGVTNTREALRFGELGEEAERFDLSNYSLRLERGRAFAELGHVSFGSQQHLASGFSSRGLSVGVPLGKVVSASFAAVNGSNLVGWSNFTGLAESDHQILSGQLAFELVPKRPGAFRLEASLLDGSLLPIAGFNQGSLIDAETSSGWALRLAGATTSQRLRFEAGYAATRFDNPFDSQLAQGADLVAVQEE